MRNGKDNDKTENPQDLLACGENLNINLTIK
jgi:hypothetical protein